MQYNKACVCEYSGTNYCGWQRQKNAKSIQKIIENALSQIYDEDVKIAGSGRTDAKVHALSQVFSFKSEKYRDNKKLVRALNGLLPSDIAILDAVDVPLNFHAGKSPKSKTYLYKIINRETPAALFAERALWIRKPIDVARLNEVLQEFVGENDFAAFCVKKTKKENTIRKINFCYAERDGEFINIYVNSNGFLHNMVRIIVGTALDFMKNNRDKSELKEIIASKDRKKAGKTVAPEGLYQYEIFYNNEGVAGLGGIKSNLGGL